MARMIDADILLEKLQRMIDYCKNDNQVNGLTALFQVGDAIMDCPTLTPPNEPLSINQLKDMKGKPVWLEFTEYDEDNEQVNYRGWALVSSEDVYKFSMFLILPEGDLDKFFEYEDYGKTWACYLRPPGGDTDGE